jgi:hypothetical protein
MDTIRKILKRPEGADTKPVMEINPAPLLEKLDQGRTKPALSDLSHILFQPGGSCSR